MYRKVHLHFKDKADLLSKLANGNLVDLPYDVWIKVLKKPSIEEKTCIMANI